MLKTLSMFFSIWVLIHVISVEDYKGVFSFSHKASAFEVYLQ